VVFKNEKQLKNFLLKKCHDALEKSQEQVYKILDKFLNDFYNDYTPGKTIEWDGKVKYSAYAYQRTYQLLNSLVKSRVVSDGKGYKAEVYFDLDSLSYAKSAWQGGNSPSGEQVFEAAKQGLHGAIGDAGGGYKFNYVAGNTGANIWNDPIKVLDAKSIEILKKMLIAEGIPIK
jgi:hypothetical protein